MCRWEIVLEVGWESTWLPLKLPAPAYSSYNTGCLWLLHNAGSFLFFWSHAAWIISRTVYCQLSPCPPAPLSSLEYSHLTGHGCLHFLWSGLRASLFIQWSTYLYLYYWNENKYCIHQNAACVCYFIVINTCGYF